MKVESGLFDEFRCVGGSCRRKCCMGWNISIDGDTADFYHSLEDEYGISLCSRLSKSEGGYIFKLDPKEDCPALNEDGLCEIFIRYGEEHMSKTCQKFPRIVIYGDNEDNHFWTLSNECEEVLRMLYDGSEKYGFYVGEGNLGETGLLFDNTKLATWASTLLQDETVPLEVGLATVISTCSAVADSVKNGVPYDVEREIGLSDDMANQLNALFMDIPPEELKELAWKKIEGIVAAYVFVIKNSNHSVYDELLPCEKKGGEFDASWDAIMGMHSEYRKWIDMKDKDLFLRKLFTNLFVWYIPYIFNKDADFPFVSQFVTSIACILSVPAMWDGDIWDDKDEYLSRMSLLHRTMKNKPFLKMVSENISLDISSAILVLAGLNGYRR